MPWDSNIVATEFKDKLPLQSFNQLQAAIKERCQGAAISVPGIFNADTIKMDMLPSNWFTLFQSTMTTLIAVYANHTDNGGNWAGQATIPNWTEATMLAAIGDASRIPAPSSRACVAWCFQQYKMLNLLRWVNESFFWDIGEIRAGGDVALFSNAVSDFTANSWGPYAWRSIGHYMSRFADGSVSIQRLRSNAHFTNARYFDILIDWYGRARKVGTGYENNDFGVAENTFISLGVDISCLSGETADLQGGYIDTVSATDSAAPLQKGWGIEEASPYADEDKRRILKFDGPAGFTFKDW